MKTLFNILILTAIFYCTVSISYIHAQENQTQNSVEITATKNAAIIEPKVRDLMKKYNLSTSNVIILLESYIRKGDISEVNIKALEIVIDTLKSDINNSDKKQKNSDEIILPNHGRFSTKESILSYRIDYSYREKYLKFKDEDVLSSYIYKKDIGEKIVYLTFDDGPYDYQKELVDYIIEEEIPSTFFLLCEKMNKSNTQVYKRDFITVGLHTNTHANYDNLTKDQILNDIHACNLKFDELNFNKKIFRPAYGIVNRNESEALVMNNLEGVIWSMDSFDWSGDFKEKRINEMLESVSWGEIILFHENVDIEMFKKFVTGLKEKGYSFGKL